MPLFPFSGPSKQPNTRLDTSLRPICFGMDPNVSPDIAKQVGAETFKRYEFVLYLMAQLSRIVYCDSGIGRQVIETSLGMSNDIVNKVITAFDSHFAKTRRAPITSQKGDGMGLPMESYSLTTKAQGPCWGTYISTKDDMTCLMLNATQQYTPRLFKNPNNIFTEGDAIVSFKGSSTMANFKHDLLSQFTAADLGALLASTGVKVEGVDNRVTGAFIKPLVNAWSLLMKGLETHIKQDNTRLFLTGHSLGGAYTTLFGFILAEGKATGTLPIMSKVKSIHIVSFGSPTLLSDTARNTFNRHLDSGFITLDRVVSQKVPTRTALTQVAVGGIAGPNDVIPTIPVGFTHPGYKPLATNMNPEAKGRPYSVDNVRKFYGVPSDSRYRDPATWPFAEDINYGDLSRRKELLDYVRKMTGIVVQDTTEAETEAAVAQMKQMTPEGVPNPGVQQGGLGAQKSIYESKTADRIPNFLSIRGSAQAYGFAHAEYMGMFFMGAFRTAGMKNPSNTYPAYFEMCQDGMRINYIGLDMPLSGGRNYKIRRSKTAKSKKSKKIYRKSQTRRH